MLSSVEDFALRIGSYVPRSAGAGGSYFSGSARIDPGRAASGGVLAVAPPQDEYIPSNAPASAETEGADAEKEAAGGEFTPEEQRVINELKITDREVRAHEQAHISVGGSYILGGPVFDYESGPDSKRYAVGGEVSIDSSPEHDNPEATIAKMQVVRAAALAPADPSAQDRAVASAASREESRARGELSEKRAAEAQARNAGFKYIDFTSFNAFNSK